MKKRQSQMAPVDKKSKISHDDGEQVKVKAPSKKAKADSVRVWLGTQAAAAWKRFSEAVGLGRQGHPVVVKKRKSSHDDEEYVKGKPSPKKARTFELQVKDSATVCRST
jgi:hypothetical protein